MQVAAISPVQPISAPAAPQQPGSDEPDGFSRALQQARKATTRQSHDKPGPNGQSPQAAPQKAGHHPGGKVGTQGGGDGDEAVAAADRAADPVVPDTQADRPRGLAADAHPADVTPAAEPPLEPARPPAWLPPGLRTDLGRTAATVDPAKAEPADEGGLDVATDAGDRARPARAGTTASLGALGTEIDRAQAGHGRLDTLGQDDVADGSDAPLSAPGTGFGQTLRQITAEATPAAAAPTAMPAASGVWASSPDVAETAAGAAVPEREIRAPLHSPAFAPALGAQLTLLVKEGVTEARLHLNPAEMGPIAVQIQLEGHQARVEMVAEHAATRQALEQSMPSLASALRDSGLTLTGGGVFEQSTRQGQPGDAPARSQAAAGTGNRGDASPDGGTEALARPMARPRGVVDLYA